MLKSMNKTTVLVIDDEQSFIDVITHTLTSENYKVIQALDGKMGIMVAHKFLPDIIISDWEMPVMDGIEAIKILKQDDSTKDIPIIMATGKMTSAKNLNTALNAGAVDYIRKPIEPIELLARINSALKLAHSISELKTLKGIIPICMHCKKIRNSDGDWNQLEEYISEHSGAQFSHGICDKCYKKYYSENED